MQLPYEPDKYEQYRSPVYDSVGEMPVPEEVGEGGCWTLEKGLGFTWWVTSSSGVHPKKLRGGSRWTKRNGGIPTTTVTKKWEGKRVGSAKRPQLQIRFEEAKEAERKWSGKKEEHRSFVTLLWGLCRWEENMGIFHRKSESLGKDWRFINTWGWKIGKGF